jgi:hypothetical protein
VHLLSCRSSLTCSLYIILIKIGGRGVLHILILTSYLLCWIWPWCELKVSSGLGVVTPTSTMSSKPSTTLKITSPLRSTILPLALLASSTYYEKTFLFHFSLSYHAIILSFIILSSHGHSHGSHRSPNLSRDQIT